MSSKYKIRNNDALHFVTFSVVNWIDVFTRNLYKDLFLDSLRFCQKEKGLLVHAYCIMTNHVHLILAIQEDNSLMETIRDVKKFTSTSLVKAIKDNPKESRKKWMLWMFERAGARNNNNINHQFWQQGYHPIELSDNYMIDQKLDYIHKNPVKAGFVLSPEEYLYSSAKNYAGLENIFEATLID